MGFPQKEHILTCVAGSDGRAQLSVPHSNRPASTTPGSDRQHTGSSPSWCGGRSRKPCGSWPSSALNADFGLRTRTVWAPSLKGCNHQDEMTSYKQGGQIPGIPVGEAGQEEQNSGLPISKQEVPQGPWDGLSRIPRSKAWVQRERSPLVGSLSVQETGPLFSSQALAEPSQLIFILPPPEGRLPRVQLPSPRPSPCFTSSDGCPLSWTTRMLGRG